MPKRDWVEKIRRDGFAVVPKPAPPALVRALQDALNECRHPLGRTRGARVYAMRNLLLLPEVCDLASHPDMRNLVGCVLGKSALPVRGIFFDKTTGANWKVAWHQDLSIAVRERIDVAGFGPWSVKAGVVHVQPPREVLERMLTLRIHLDPCGADNGPLRVIPGSHLHGILPPFDVHGLCRAGPIVTCEVPRGGILLMRPLLLHASSSATQPAHRRVVHLEFSADDLPGGLQWHAL